MFLLPLVAMVASARSPHARLIGFEPNLLFPPAGQELVKVYTDVDPDFPFNELIASWNVDQAETAAITIEVQAHGKTFDTRWYTMGEWSLDGKAGPRESVKGQRDSFGKVDTDTLSLNRVAEHLNIRVALRTVGDGPRAKLKLLTLALMDGEPVASDAATPSSAWGRTVDVPQRAQGNYPNGGVLCSATSMSMILWHYANQLGRPEINKDVPEVEQHVWDPVYKGAGNWPFNTAYVGSFKGLRAYVARFEGTQNLETWIEQGYPVVCSVSFDMLRGLPLSPTESGHLVVLVGFDEHGDPVINDPAFKNQVRKTYKRADFEKAWEYSKRTVYLVYPEHAQIPKSPDGLWMAPH